MQLMLFAVLASATAAPTGGQSLEWSGHYAEAKIQAAEEQRPLLVVVEDSASPNGRFAQDELTSQPSHVDLLKKYRLCRMDVNTPYGKRVAEAFGADTFPMTVITDDTAKFVTFRAHGSMSREVWERTLASRANARSDGSTNAQPQRVQASKIITDWPASFSGQQMAFPVQQIGGT